MIYTYNNSSLLHDKLFILHNNYNNNNIYELLILEIHKTKIPAKKKSNSDVKNAMELFW